MLVVCANWGIGDGSLREAPSPARMAAFVDGLRRAAVLAGWQERGRYDPSPAVDLLLAGDTCDWYASRHGLEGGRPWRRDAASRRARERVVTGALLEARRTLLPLSALVRGGLTLPGADRRGRPAFDAPVSVPVRLALLEGNLDVGLAGPLRALAAAALELPAAMLCEADGLAVEHGHAGDAAWATEAEGPLLGASLRVDLVARYLASAAVERLPPVWRRALVERLLASDLLDCDALRRGARVPQLAAEERRPLEEAWRRAVEGWRQAAWSQGVGRSVPFDLLDAIAGRLLDAAAPGDGADDELARLLRPAVVRRAGTVFLGHPPVEWSRPSGAPRLFCMGGAGAAVDAAAPGVHEIGPGEAPRILPPGAVVPPGGRGGVRACPPGAIPAQWSDIPSARPAAAWRRVVEAA